MGYPGINIGVELIDAVYDEQTATEFAFEAAASLGFDNACSAASPVLLEPVMKVDVLVPKEFYGRYDKRYHDPWRYRPLGREPTERRTYRCRGAPPKDVWVQYGP
jgi:hypothetical protein